MNMRPSVERAPSVGIRTGIRVALAFAALWVICAPSLHGRCPGEGDAAMPIVPLTERTMAMMDTLPLLPVEGIWEYPQDEVRVAVLRDAMSPNRFLITVLESADPRLQPTDTLGWLVPTAKTDRFELTQYRHRRENLLDLPGKCQARLSSDGWSIVVGNASRLQVSLNPTALLPRFWRVARVKLTSSADGNGSEGMVKTYPSEDGPGILRKPKRWL